MMPLSSGGYGGPRLFERHPNRADAVSKQVVHSVRESAGTGRMRAKNCHDRSPARKNSPSESVDVTVSERSEQGSEDASVVRQTATFGTPVPSRSRRPAVSGRRGTRCGKGMMHPHSREQQIPP